MAMAENTCIIASASVFGGLLVFIGLLIFDGVLDVGWKFVVSGVACFFFFFFLFVLLFVMTGNYRSLVLVVEIIWLLLYLWSLLGGGDTCDVGLVE